MTIEKYEEISEFVQKLCIYIDPNYSHACLGYNMSKALIIDTQKVTGIKICHVIVVIYWIPVLRFKSVHCTCSRNDLNLNDLPDQYIV